MNTRILSVNPGSTSTKVAVYDNENPLFIKNYAHTSEELSVFKNIIDQEDMRTQVVLNALKEHQILLESLDAVVGRGGILPPVKSGGYVVNEAMLYRLRNCPLEKHASNLGGIIAYKIAEQLGKTAYIYDSVAVCEYINEAYLTGIPEIRRTCFSHALNSRSVAHQCAEKHDKKYEDMTFVVAHLGGSVTVTVHQKGRMVDIVDNDEGPFGVETCGKVSVRQVLAGVEEHGIDKMRKRARGEGGFVGLLGTADARLIEEKVLANDIDATMIVNAMAYQVGKAIGEMSAAVCGEVDAIIITGGVAYFKYLVEQIKKYVSFIAPVEVYPGDNEMQALTLGVRRILLGEEKAHEYVDKTVEEKICLEKSKQKVYVK